MQLCELVRIGRIALCALTLAACTVVELDEQGKPIIPADPSAAPGFGNQTPDHIAGQIWQTRLIPLAEQQALSWPALKQQQSALSQGQRKSVFVRFQAEVDQVDRQSREGQITLDVQGESLQLQLGPIVKGNALRDATTFLRFDDFKNQVQFAQLSRALNKRALQDLPQPDAGWRGQRVSGLAAVTLSADGISGGVPLRLHREAD